MAVQVLVSSEVVDPVDLPTCKDMSIWLSALGSLSGPAIE